MPGGGREGHAHGAALEAVGGVTVAQVGLPQTVETHHGGHGKVGRDESNKKTSVLDRSEVS